MKEIKNVLIISIVVFIAVFSAVYAKNLVDLTKAKNANQSQTLDNSNTTFTNSSEDSEIKAESNTLDAEVVTPTKVTPPAQVKPKPVAPKPVPKPAPKPAPRPAPKPTACIVTISGSRYNVTSLVNNHSGGNIFKCGTDMTTVYFSQHGSLSLIARYKI